MATGSDFRSTAHPHEYPIYFCDSEDRAAQLVCGQMFCCDCLPAWTKANKNFNSNTIDPTTTARYDNLFCSNIFSCPNCNRGMVVQKMYEKYVSIKASLHTEGKPSDVAKVLVK